MAYRRFGHRPVRRVIGLQGACCTGVGEGNPVCIRRFQEARPRPSWDRKISAHSRGGAPKGERSRMTAPASLSDAGTEGAPFGAPPPLLEALTELPPVCLRHLFLVREQKLGCEMHRGNEISCPHPEEREARLEGWGSPRCFETHCCAMLVSMRVWGTPLGTGKVILTIQTLKPDSQS